MAAQASDWLRHFLLLLWNHQMEFNETWQEAQSQRPLPSLCFLGRSEKNGRPGIWFAETLSTSPLKVRNGIQRYLTVSKIFMSSAKFMFFRPIGMAVMLFDQLRNQIWNRSTYRKFGYFCVDLFLRIFVKSV